MPHVKAERLSPQVCSVQGLGFPQISNLQTTPAFFNMLSDGQLDQPVFTLYLNPDVTKEPAGELAFGTIDATRYVGKLTYTPVVEKKCVPPSPKFPAEEHC